MSNSTITFSQACDKYEDDFLKFERVENKTSKRADLHAFMLLDRLFPRPEGRGDIVSAAEHDEIFLGVDPDELDEVATEDQMLELIRCGVRCDSSTDSLAMFV